MSSDLGDDAPRRRVLAKNLKNYRQVRQLSARKLASEAGVSMGIVSQIESGRANPSLRTLERLCTALGVSLNQLIDRPTTASQTIETFVRRRAKRLSFEVGSAPLYKELLSPAEVGGARMMLITFPPNSDSHDVVTDPGQKAGLVMQGELELQIDGQKVTLEEGDSFQFDSTLQHSVHNRSQKETVVYWIIINDKLISHM